MKRKGVLMSMEKSNQEQLELLKNNDFFLFVFKYLRHWFKLKPATYHIELFNLFFYEKDFITIIGYRGSAKTTILQAYALYIFITKKSPFTVIIGSEGGSAKVILKNIKTEIENNAELRNDYGVTTLLNTGKVITEKWSEEQLNFNGASLLARSKGQKIRGLNVNSNRINTILMDDIEDVKSTETEVRRKVTREWFFTEVIPAMEAGILAKESKVISIGNLVHKDCLLAYLDNKDIEGFNKIKVKRIPLLNEQGYPSWPALYPNPETIEKQKEKVMLAGEGLGAIIWAREYLLKNIEEEDRVIKETDIQFYPDEWLQRKFLRGGVGVDLAISKNETADYTAMVKIFEVQNDFGERRLIVSKNNVHARLDFTETILTARRVKAEMPVSTIFYVENVAYQASAIEMMRKNGINAKAVNISKDKRARLISVSPYIKSGTVLFPKTGASDILREVLGFGVEAQDDLLDALVHAIDGMLKTPIALISSPVHE